jgi:hypothetical protein
MATKKKRKTKKKTKKVVEKVLPRRTWENGENPLGLNKVSTCSYEKYMKQALEIISKHLSIRTYKLAPAEDYPQFIRGKDMRVQIFWKKNSLYEFIVEQSFWLQSNRNKEDRSYMRGFAHVHLKIVHDAYMKAKEGQTKKKTTRRKKKK